MLAAWMGAWGPGSELSSVFIIYSTFLSYVSLVVGGGRWVVVGGRPLEATGGHRGQFPRTDVDQASQIYSSTNTARTSKASLVWGSTKQCHVYVLIHVQKYIRRLLRVATPHPTYATRPNGHHFHNTLNKIYKSWFVCIV